MSKPFVRTFHRRLCPAHHIAMNSVKLPELICFTQNTTSFLSSQIKNKQCPLYRSKLLYTDTRIPDHLTCPLRNSYAGQEAIFRTGHGTTDWFQIWKGVHQGCMLSPCLFDLYAECIMWNAGLDEAQAGIKMAGRNISNLRYADDITFMAESKEELKSLLMKVKEESEKVDLKLNIQKTKIMASGPITSWQIDEETRETVRGFILGGLQNHCRWCLQPRN